MKFLGKLSHTTKNGNIVLRSGEIPAIYSFVVNKDSKRIGTVRDVIGPSSKPYIVVKPVRRFTEKELRSFDFYEQQRR